MEPQHFPLPTQKLYLLPVQVGRRNLLFYIFLFDRRCCISHQRPVLRSVFTNPWKIKIFWPKGSSISLWKLKIEIPATLSDNVSQSSTMFRSQPGIIRKTAINSIQKENLGAFNNIISLYELSRYNFNKTCPLKKNLAIVKVR